MRKPARTIFLAPLARRRPNAPVAARAESRLLSIALPWHWQCGNAQIRKRAPYRFSLNAERSSRRQNIRSALGSEVLYLILTSKKGISALQIHRTIGSGSYDTALYMCHRLRAALNDPEFRQLMGIVEVDETYIGGKDNNRHWDKKQHGTRRMGKTPVIGAIARKGNVVCKMIENADIPTLTRFVHDVAAATKFSWLRPMSTPATGYLNVDCLPMNDPARQRRIRARPRSH